jgi:hypothetical protein
MTSGSRWGLALLVGLALLLPLGALLQPWLLPSRSSLPVVEPELVVPVVLVTVAGLRVDHVGHLQGADRWAKGSYAEAPAPPPPGGSLTPSLDRLAEQAVTFTHAYATSDDDLLTAATLLTGTCPGQHGVHRGADVLDERAPTLAERFAARGYTPLAVVADPRLRGHGLEQGFETFAARPRASADAVVDEALQLLHSQQNERWLLWIDLADLLPPYGGDDLDLAPFAPDAPPGFGSEPGAYFLTADDWAARGWGSRQAGWLSARYDAAVSRVDAALGRFFSALEQENRLETMYVVLTGTSGTRLDERPELLFAHGVDLYEPSLRVPLFVRLPSQYIRGVDLHGPVSSVDVAPAIADMVLRRAWRGAVEPTLWRIIEEQARLLPRRVFAEGPVRLPGEPPWTGYVVRTGGAKIITDREGTRMRAYPMQPEPDESVGRELGRAQAEVVLGQLERWLKTCEW